MKLDLEAAGLIAPDHDDHAGGAWSDTTSPCLLCGRPVKDGKGKTFWLHGGGGTIITTDQDAEDLGGSAADLGAYPIGPNCYRKHKAVLEPFVIAVEDIP